jgi:hypothetical protein
MRNLIVTLASATLLLGVTAPAFAGGVAANHAAFAAMHAAAAAGHVKHHRRHLGHRHHHFVSK